MANSTLIDWSLAARTPTLRYLALRRLLGQSGEEPAVQKARQEMLAEGPIPSILARQAANGAWIGERSYYTPKYTSTHWSMLLLVELCADPADPRLRLGADFMLARTEQELREVLRRGEVGLSCFWGNLLRYGLYAGAAQDERIERIGRYLVHDALEGGWRCRHNGDLPCAWGAARALWGLAAIPPGQRSSDVLAAIQKGVSFLLEEYDLAPASYPPADRLNAAWSRLNFPLFYQADVLFVLRALADLEALDHPGARRALAWLQERRLPTGRWRGASPFRLRTWDLHLDREETDRWISLQAAIILRKAFPQLPI